MFTTRKLFEYGGVAASIVLVAFGIAAIVLGANGRSTVHNNLALEQIVGTPGHDAERDQGRGQAGSQWRARVIGAHVKTMPRAG